jgi:hypothetical protein
VDAALGLVPANASILTQNDLFSQVSNRANAYLYITDNRTSVQYILADVKSPSYVLAGHGTQSMKKWVPYFMSSGRYGIVANDDGVILLKANYSGSVLLSGSTHYLFDYQSLTLLTGSIVPDSTSVSRTVLLHSASDKDGVTFWFGPYASLPPGEYNATFVLKTSSVTNGSLQLQVSTFLDANNIPVLAEQNLTQASFAQPGSWTKFNLTFDYTPQQAALGTLEFRGVNVFGGPFSLDYVGVTYISPYGS